MTCSSRWNLFDQFCPNQTLLKDFRVSKEEFCLLITELNVSCWFTKFCWLISCSTKFSASLRGGGGGRTVFQRVIFRTSSGNTHGSGYTNSLPSRGKINKCSLSYPSETRGRFKMLIFWSGGVYGYFAWFEYLCQSLYFKYLQSYLIY